MSLEADDRDQGELSQLELESPRPSVSGYEPALAVRKDAVRARAQRPERRAEVQPLREEPAVEQDRERGDKPRRGHLRRHPLAFLLGLLLCISGIGAGYLYWDNARHFESTDDAFIAARQFAIAPKVSGYITAVPVTDNQHVGVGDVIARIDDRDYRTALEQAQAQVAAAQANIQNIDAQTNVQQAQISANQAQLKQVEAALVFAQEQAGRYQHLAHTGYGSVQNSQQYTSQLNQQEAAVQSAQANLKLAQRQIETLKAQRASADASLAQAQAQRNQAQLNLSYTTVTANQPGRVVQLSTAVGQFVQPGTALTMFVPDDIWVTANFKETQLDAMRPGQPVTLEIDAYPKRAIRGHVASVQPGSGTAFSLLPAQNATGNYVKIVQRVPVKIIIDNPSADVALGPGMSVVPTVRTNSKPSLYEKVTAWI